MSDARYTEIAFVVTPEKAEEWIATLVEIGATRRRGARPDHLSEGGRREHAHAGGVDSRRRSARVPRAAQAAGLPPPAEASRERDEDEWRDVWKQYFAPRKVGRFVIVPSWEKYAAKPDEVVLDMDPGRAFGTGGHPSTRLCLVAISELRALRALPRRGVRLGRPGDCLRQAFGEASGIAVDVDADAVDVSRENAMRNAVIERISVSATPVEEVHGPFDVVTANILPDVLVPLAGPIAARVGEGGTLDLERHPARARRRGRSGVRRAGPAHDGAARRRRLARARDGAMRRRS